MPWSLMRLQQSGDLHFITFSCRHRSPLLEPAACKQVFIDALEATRVRSGIDVYGYVVMPEHVHLLVSEPEGPPLSLVLQGLKQGVSWRIGKGKATGSLWETRYYDFNVYSDTKLKEKLRYIHRNPVHRGLVSDPCEWPWSSFRQYLTGEPGVVKLVLRPDDSGPSRSGPASAGRR
jgi:putative transposase